MKLYHCKDARSLRPLWALEELGLDYELVNMAFPPRATYPGYLNINPLGTVPTFTDGDLTMTESSATIWPKPISPTPCGLILRKRPMAST